MDIVLIAYLAGWGFVALALAFGMIARENITNLLDFVFFGVLATLLSIIVAVVWPLVVFLVAAYLLIALTPHVWKVCRK